MENLGHGRELSLTESLGGGSHHPWGRASLQPGPALTPGMISQDRGHHAWMGVMVPTVLGEAGGSCHSLWQLLWAVTGTSKNWSHTWLTGQADPWGPRDPTSPHWAPTASGTGTGEPILPGRRQEANLCSD